MLIKLLILEQAKLKKEMEEEKRAHAKELQASNEKLLSALDKTNPPRESIDSQPPLGRAEQSSQLTHRKDDRTPPSYEPSTEAPSTTERAPLLNPWPADGLQRSFPEWHGCCQVQDRTLSSRERTLGHSGMQRLQLAFRVQGHSD